MLGYFPKRPDGPPTAQTRFMQWVHDYITQHGRVGTVPGARVNTTVRGTFVIPEAVTAVPAAAGTANRYVTIISDGGDYLVCRPYGVSGSGSDFGVAKPFAHRTSLASATVDGVAIAYSAYTADGAGLYNQRTGSGNGATQKEAPDPRYFVGEPLIAMPVDHTGVTVSGAELKWIDANVDGRFWERKYNQA